MADYSHPASPALASQKCSHQPGSGSKIKPQPIDFVADPNDRRLKGATSPHISKREATTPHQNPRRRRPQVAQSHHLTDHELADLQGATALADARGTPFNEAFTINWQATRLKSGRTMDKFAKVRNDLRKKFWDRDIEFIFAAVHEQASSDHTHFMIHLPPGKKIDRAFICKAIRKAVGVGERNATAVKAEKRDDWWAVYIAKGCNPEAREKAAIPVDWHKEQGPIIGKRLQLSRNLDRNSQKSCPDLDVEGCWDRVVRRANEILIFKKLAKEKQSRRERRPGDIPKWIGEMNHAVAAGIRANQHLDLSVPDSIATTP